MAIKRARLKPRAKSMIAAPTREQRLALFGPPLLLEGEDEAAYDELLGRIYAAVKPANVLEETFIADVVFLEWDVLRWRRLRSSVLRASGQKALEAFLAEELDYDLYVEVFTKDLAEYLERYIEEDEAQELAQQCARSEPGADEKVHEVLSGHGPNLDYIQDEAKANRAKELVRAYARRELDAINQFGELLASSGLTLHDMMAEGLTANIEEIERIDRLITIAERRRNASLREIDRRRAVLGEAVRRNLQEVEDAEFEVVETTRREGKSAA
jgi:hypothetical protein